MNFEEVAKAKEVLKANGYFVDNLWHVDDVLAIPLNQVSQDEHSC